MKQETGDSTYLKKLDQLSVTSLDEAVAVLSQEYRKGTQLRPPPSSASRIDTGLFITPKIGKSFGLYEVSTKTLPPHNEGTILEIDNKFYKVDKVLREDYRSFLKYFFAPVNKEEVLNYLSVWRDGIRFHVHPPGSRYTKAEYLKETAGREILSEPPVKETTVEEKGDGFIVRSLEHRNFETKKQWHDDKKEYFLDQWDLVYGEIRVTKSGDVIIPKKWKVVAKCEEVSSREIRKNFEDQLAQLHESAKSGDKKSIQSLRKIWLNQYSWVSEIPKKESDSEIVYLVKPIVFDAGTEYYDRLDKKVCAFAARALEELDDRFYRDEQARRDEHARWEVIKKYKDQLKTNPKDAKVCYLLACTLLGAGNFKEALTYAEKADKLKPSKITKKLINEIQNKLNK